MVSLSNKIKVVHLHYSPHLHLSLFFFSYQQSKLIFHLIPVLFCFVLSRFCIVFLLDRGARLIGNTMQTCGSSTKKLCLKVQNKDKLIEGNQTIWHGLDVAHVTPIFCDMPADGIYVYFHFSSLFFFKKKLSLSSFHKDLISNEGLSCG